MALEYRLGRLDHDFDAALEYFRNIKDRAKALYGFSRHHVERLATGLSRLASIEQKYFIAMVASTAREHRLAKTGLEGDMRNKGQAALWLNALSEKERQYEVLSRITIVDNLAGQAEPTIRFAFSPYTNPLANFRQGDLVIVYPAVNHSYPLGSQLIKGTLVRLDEQEITVQLRARQMNQRFFDDHQYWNVEHDTLDSAFGHTYRWLSSWLAADHVQRSRYLGLKAPEQPGVDIWDNLGELTDEQNAIMRKILSAQDYFLLWGPPGTGKTSVMLGQLVGHLYEHTGETLLVLAYTNRAVDEICEAIYTVPRTAMVRIGSKHGASEDFHDMLLERRMSGAKTRQELLSILRQFRIVVGTISSVLGRPELFEIVHFDRLIVDEASQITEAMMAGLLTRFRKVLLIGDHRQLPAVVVQSQVDRQVRDNDLRALGLVDLGNSYFERMFGLCEKHEWHWAFDKLTIQGRMHQDIMGFVSQHFYRGILRILPAHMGGKRQQDKLPYSTDANGLMQLLATWRMVFLPVTSIENPHSKVNSRESAGVLQVVAALRQLHREPSLALVPQSVGIITPYRAQIAQIRTDLQKARLFGLDMTVDTVERYQGGSRDIIIISLCANSRHQLHNLVSLSADGIDRKLNVALTRARQQVIVLGDPAILSANAVYADFINRFRVDEPLLRDGMPEDDRN